MRLHRFKVNNFKGIKHVSVEWDDLLLLIGENNIGKSAILRALDYFLSGAAIRDPMLFKNKVTDYDNAIELIGHFDQLTDQEKEGHAVKGRMHDDEWIIRKTFWEEKNPTDASKPTWKELYHSFSTSDTFQDWPESTSSWNNFPEEYGTAIENIKGEAKKPHAALLETLKQHIKEHNPELHSKSDPAWIPNPGGGGNWKSNANSILPEMVFVEAVHDVSEESVSKESSAYGKIVGLIVEKRMMGKPEVQALKEHVENVLKLFRPDPEHPENQAEEIKDIENRINERLNQVIGGIAKIETESIDVKPLILPSTYLVLKDREDGIETLPSYQGHGLQRTLIMTLVQLLAEVTTETAEGEGEPPETKNRIIAIEEPELYMHPQMERKMRDSLYALAEQGYQVICSTHSPVFLDMSNKHRAIVRLYKNQADEVKFFQVNEELFPEGTQREERDRLMMISRFDSIANEIFFAKRVVLFEEESAMWAIERTAELTGIFERSPHVKHDVTMINCRCKGDIKSFQVVLNHFDISYLVVHDEDTHNPAAARENPAIETLLTTNGRTNKRHMISPNDLEYLLRYEARKDKRYRAVKRVEELHRDNNLPEELIAVVNMVYFDQLTEPTQT